MSGRGRHSRADNPSQPQKEWVQPSDEQIMADGGHFDEHGWWISIPRELSRKRASLAMHRLRTPEERTERARKAAMAVPLETQRANAARASKATTPETRCANLAKANKARTLQTAFKAAKTCRGRIRSNNTSGHTGVNWHVTTSRWTARIVINGRSKHIGRFETLEEAVAARKAAELKYWKD